jgi:hypothetical protein
MKGWAARSVCAAKCINDRFAARVRKWHGQAGQRYGIDVRELPAADP